MASEFSRICRREMGPLAKVCGLTRQGDVETVARLGADLIGFVSHEPSPRHVADLVIVALAGTVREAAKRSVLVTVNRDRAGVDRLVVDAELDAVQLCGDESPDDWNKTDYGVLRRIAVDERAHVEMAAWSGIADAFVLDHPSSAGGSGRPVDLRLAAALAQEAPCLLAGGLSGFAECFDAGSESFRRIFLGYDASSRLETSPGVKDPDLVQRFVAAAHHDLSRATR